LFFYICNKMFISTRQHNDEKIGIINLLIYSLLGLLDLMGN